MAAATTASQAIWLRRILADMGDEQTKPTIIYCDNKSAIAMAKNLVQHSQTKHIAIKNCPLLKLAPLEAVLFDIDGTLCDTDPLHYDAFREMLQEIGFNGGVPIDEDFFVKNIAGRHNEDIASILFPDDHERGVKFLDDKEAMFRRFSYRAFFLILNGNYRIVKEKIEPVKGLHKLTKWIEDRGLKRAAVTNAPRENAELMISLLGLSDFFQALILGSDCEHAKPFPDPYLKALEILNVSKEHTCVFEDSVSGIKAGVAAGLPTVGLTTRNPAELLMEAKPALLIKDYEDAKLWTVLDELDKTASVKTGAE
ncbi:PREDICTED: haloacid dehalogenase-like hydrolase domain-containing protein Sgpp [Erythranthe guttata]|uniref:haloacid dehalogenase-like hydrolase domain-containing protein Sgpp n=1 Tax=Erythranthe guttata TaxID=4155 RepID=UPI00064DA70A|nr:PREDICTED: haloacid dehalogenase-like hydrolase domain-containing protein Sgpp [Erythranthe guttata]|eukprot:XP_012842626.1 PREDICTED: haloacid dehalogenase-like hydrolase domain-containing protein Sgpp [Erythranthe guttata]